MALSELLQLLDQPLVPRRRVGYKMFYEGLNGKHQHQIFQALPRQLKHLDSPHQGPGGGTVFYVDTEGRYSDFDYLEVAPTDVSTSVAWSTTTPDCDLLADTDCQTAFLTTSGEALNYVAMGTGRAATAAIIARHDAGEVSPAAYAAGVADAYTTPTASDWFLPSKDELNEVCKYARNTGQATGAAIVCAGGLLRDDFSGNVFWSSSEYDDNDAWFQAFGDGYQASYLKNYSYFVRPVRAF